MLENWRLHIFGPGDRCQHRVAGNVRQGWRWVVLAAAPRAAVCYELRNVPTRAAKSWFERAAV
jgi:hypothetical protein